MDSIDDYGRDIFGKPPSPGKEVKGKNGTTIEKSTKWQMKPCKDIVKKETLATFMLHGAEQTF